MGKQPNLPKNIGRYKIIVKLAEGGMGILYKARDPMMGRLVAMKVFKIVKDEDSELLSRLVRWEAFISGKLLHPNIVTIYDVFIQADTGYIVMEYIDGLDLWRLSKGKHRLPIESIVDIMYQCCSALDCAHRNNIVHLDIKPSNILVQNNGMVKIIDFGMAQFLTESSIPFTRPLEKGGTPAYLSPELVQDEIYDDRSDIFSLGVVLYEILTGKNPFTANNFAKALYNIVHVEPAPPSKIAEHVPPAFDIILNKALGKHPDERYQDIMEMAYDLKNYQSLEEEKEDRSSYEDLSILLASSKKEDKTGHKNISLFVLDDDAHTTQFFNKVFSQEGYLIQCRDSLDNALDIVRLQEPHLILVDAYMSQMEGYDFCKSLRRDEKLKDTPFIFMLSDNKTFTRFQHYRPGYDDYLLKPFHLQEVVSRVRTALENSGVLYSQQVRKPMTESVKTIAPVKDVSEAISQERLPEALNLCIEKLSDNQGDYQALKYIEIIKVQLRYLIEHQMADSQEFDYREILEHAIGFYNCNCWEISRDLLEIVLLLRSENRKARSYFELVNRRINERYDQKLHPLNRVPVMTSMSPNIIKTRVFSSEEGYLLSRVDGRTTFEQLIRLSGLDRTVAMKTLCDLLDKELISIVKTK